MFFLPSSNNWVIKTLKRLTICVHSSFMLYSIIFLSSKLGVFFPSPDKIQNLFVIDYSISYHCKSLDIQNGCQVSDMQLSLHWLDLLPPMFLCYYLMKFYWWTLVVYLSPLILLNKVLELKLLKKFQFRRDALSLVGVKAKS